MAQVTGSSYKHYVVINGKRVLRSVGEFKPVRRGDVPASVMKKLDRMLRETAPKRKAK